MVYHQKNGVQIMPFFGKELYMTSIKSKKIKVFTLICLLAAVALAAVRTFMLTTIVEPDTGLYSAGTVGGYVFDVGVLLVLAVLIVVGKILFKKHDSFCEPDSGSTVTVFGSGLCALMLFSAFLYGAYLMLFAENTEGTFVHEAIVAYRTPIVLEDGKQIRNVGPIVFKGIQILMFLPCGFNHLLICAKEKREKNISHALLSMSVPVLFALRVIDVFMSYETQMNTSQRSLELLMLCAMMLFYMYESSFLTERSDEAVLKPKFTNYYIAALAVVCITCIAAVPYLLVSIFWVFESSFIVMDVLECCVMLYAASRIVTAHD